ncbi:MAG: efflux RND transporter periplasmic adaptor subunit [Pseudomonadota bacterium]
MAAADKHRWTRRLLFAAVGLSLALALILALRPSPVAVDSASVTRGALVVTIDEEGKTRVRDVYRVAAPVTGHLLRISWEVGDPVVAGATVLAHLQPVSPGFLDLRNQRQAEAEMAAAAAALRQAQAELQRALAERDYAASEFARANRLVETGTAAPATLDRARAALDAARASVSSAQAAIDVAAYKREAAKAGLIAPYLAAGEGPEAPCCALALHAPINGVILRLWEESETVVPAGAALVEVGDAQDLEVVVELLSRDAVRIAPGAAVEVIDWGGKETLAGVVRQVEPFGYTKVSALGVEEQRVNVIIDFTGPPEARAALGHGYRIEARIAVWRGEDVVKVNEAALFRAGDDWAVYALVEGRARLRLVKVGERNGREAQLLGGLEAGDRVVLYPGEKVEDGARLKARPR